MDESDTWSWQLIALMKEGSAFTQPPVKTNPTATLERNLTVSPGYRSLLLLCTYAPAKDVTALL